MELRAIIAPFRKWWWLLVIATVLAGSSTYLVLSRMPDMYRARSLLMVGRAISNPNPNAAEIYLTQQLAATYVDLARREPVADATLAALNLTHLPAYDVAVVPTTQLLEITVTDQDPAQAQAVANELARQMVRQAPGSGQGEQDQRQAFINQQLDDLEASIKATRDEIAKRQLDLVGMFSGTQIADTQQGIAGLQNKLATLQANYAQMLAGTQRGAVNSISIVAEAKLPIAPVNSGLGNKVLLACIVGFLLGVSLIYLLVYLDDSLKNPEEVQNALGLTTLGAVPAVDGLKADRQVIMTGEKHSAASEAYRVLRTNLQFAAVGRPLHSLLITSPEPGEGKSMTAANLAVALTQAGRRVTLVDADLHRPRQHHIFHLPNSTGITTALLAEHANLDELLQDSGFPGLRVLTSGPLPPNAAELLGSSAMQKLLAQLAGAADIIILDSPPATALADAAVLATQADGVLLVLDAARTRRDMARRAIEALKRVQAHVIGAVLNRMPTRGAGSYYYYYDHYSQYYTSGDGNNGSHRGTEPKRRKLGSRGQKDDLLASSPPKA